MANNRIQVKRTSTTGRTANTTDIANTQYIAAGELALNMTDGILYSSNGSALITVGANNINVNITSTLTVGNSTVNTAINSTSFALGNSSIRLSANSSGIGSGDTIAIFSKLKTHTGYFLNNGTNGWALPFGSFNNAGSTTGGFTNSTIFALTANGGYGWTSANVGSDQASPVIDTAIFKLSPGIVYVSNGTVGNYGNLVVNSFTANSIYANGSFGTAGQVLTTNGTTVYWSTVSGGGGGSGTVTSVATGNGMTGGPITTTGTVSVLANTGIVANSTGVFVNAAYIATIASNSATYANSSVTNTFTVGTASYFVSNGNLGIGTASPGYKLEVTGSFAATTKSFVIKHPTKPNMTLRYGSLEGPENGVYIRGKSNSNVIELPEYWVNLVYEDSITVSLTPIGNSVIPRVGAVADNKVYIKGSVSKLNYFYHIFAERKDVDKLLVEF